ncbi:MAG: cytidylate kinase-like family protein, partial [Gemmatimonadota bacterium]|nr:cytidylate kinase-like family protein [Gemmatimonadota bacterium]
MAMITVSREYGSGGALIAEQTAQALNWTVIDQNLVERVAERIGLPTEDVARRDERVPTLLERLAKSLTVSSPEVFMASAGIPTETVGDDELLSMTQAVITELAAQGNAVLVGRGGQACLENRADMLHVRVIAPREHRISAIVKRKDVSSEDAEKMMDEIDTARKAYLSTHYGIRWDDPSLYHLTINTG